MAAFPATIRVPCPACLTEFDLPAQAVEAPSEDPRYVGYMVILDHRPIIEHAKLGDCPALDGST